MVHVHVATWIVGSPRIDKVCIEAELTGATDSVAETVYAEEGAVRMDDDSAARCLSAFWSRIYTEWNAAKTDSETAGRVGARKLLGKQKEKETLSPDMISDKALQALLQAADEHNAPAVDWTELAEILTGSLDPAVKAELNSKEGISRVHAARFAFVAAISQWTQMHDLHDPFPQGPPAKTQACCKIDNEHSSTERTSCGKLYPRSEVPASAAVIQEDPRRRELYRLWLSRNCLFINNYVPVLMLATVSNMDFQATTTKFGVIEYMTIHMTKTDHGSLLGVMENSFAKCIDRAREEQKGVKSATAKFFNAAAVQDVKSQLETMHMAFEMPRFLCSREFRRLATRPGMKRIPEPEEITAEMKRTGILTPGVKGESYLRRTQLPAPSTMVFKQVHPLTHKPLWKHVLDSVCCMQTNTVDEALCQTRLDHINEDHGCDQAKQHWKNYVDLLSWWEFERFFKKVPGSQTLCMKPAADVVVVSPAPRLAKACPDKEFAIACRHALIAYCCHGPEHAWFQNGESLTALPDDVVMQRMYTFALSDKAGRRELRVNDCPIFLRRSYVLGRFRSEKLKGRMLVVEDVASKVQRAVRAQDDQAAKTNAPTMWKLKVWEQMSPEQKEAAIQAWSAADARVEASLADETMENSYGTRRMLSFLVSDMGLKTKDLHDACVQFSSLPSQSLSMLSYFNVLYQQAGHAKYASEPQNAKSHTVKVMKEVLKICLLYTSDAADE